MQAFDKHRKYKDISTFIKKEFEKRRVPRTPCIFLVSPLLWHVGHAFLNAHSVARQLANWRRLRTQVPAERQGDRGGFPRCRRVSFWR